MVERPPSETEPLLKGQHLQRHQGQGSLTSGDQGDSGQEKDDSDVEVSPALALRCQLVSTLVLLFFMAGNSITAPLLSQYVYYRKSLVYLNATNPNLTHPSPCVQDNSSSPEQKATFLHIQQETADFFVYSSSVMGVLATFSNLIFGSYSDYIGRRILFLIPILGAILKAALLVVIMHWSLALDWLYLVASVDGLTGSFFAILLACLAVSADVTRPDQQRTKAITVVEASLTLVVGIFLLANGVLIDAVGFLWPAVLMLAAACLSGLPVVFFLPETLRRKSTKVWSPLHHLRNTLGFYFFDGTTRKKVCYALLLGTFFFTNVSVFARSGLESVYQLSEPFCWSAKKIAYFGAASSVSRAVGYPLTLLLLQRCIGDELIAAVGLVLGAGSLVLEGVAVNDLQMYLSALFSSMGAVEAMCSLGSSLLYNAVYAATVADFKGTVFLTIAGTTTIGTVCILVFKCIKAEEKTEEKTVGS